MNSIVMLVWMSTSPGIASEGSVSLTVESEHDSDLWEEVDEPAGQSLTLDSWFVGETLEIQADLSSSSAPLFAVEVGRLADRAVAGGAAEEVAWGVIEAPVEGLLRAKFSSDLRESDWGLLEVRITPVDVEGFPLGSAITQVFEDNVIL